jgi:hypothetical protein
MNYRMAGTGRPGNGTFGAGGVVRFLWSLTLGSADPMSQHRDMGHPCGVLLRLPTYQSEMWGNHFVAHSKEKYVPSSAGGLL